jgi:hypothetical protein
MSDRKVKISVETTADTKGIVESEKGLQKLNKTADDTNKKTKGASEGTKQFGQVAGKAAELTGNLSNALNQGGPAAQQMAAGMRSLGAALNGLQGGKLGLITLAIGLAITLWVKYQNAVEAAKKKIEEFNATQREKGLAKQQTEIRALSEEYDALTRSLKGASEAQEALWAAWDKADSANRKMLLAEITYNEKLAMSKIDPDSKTAEVDTAKVKARYSARRADVNLEYDARASIRNIDRAQGYEQDIRREMGVQAGALDQLQQKQESLAAQKKAAEDAIENATLRPTADAAAMKKTIDTNKQLLEGSNGVPGVVKQLEEVSGQLKEISAAMAKNETLLKPAAIQTRAAQVEYDALAASGPAINALDASMDQRAIKKQQAQANLELYRGRLDKTLQDTQARYDAQRAAAAQFDAKDYRGAGSRERTWASNHDRELDRDAADTGRSLESLKGLKKKIEGATQKEAEAWVRSVERVLDTQDKRNSEFWRAANQRINDIEARAKRPGSGG